MTLWIQAGRSDSYLYDSRDRIWRQGTHGNVLVAINRPKHRPLGDSRSGKPSLQCPDRAERAFHFGDGYTPPAPLLIGLAAAEGDEDALGHPFDGPAIDRHQLGPPEGTGKADQQERPIPQVLQATAQS